MIEFMHSPLVFLLFAAELASLVILVHQGAVNAFLYRGTGRRRLRTYAHFCGWSAALAASYVLLHVQSDSRRYYEFVLHMLSVTGTMAMCFYMASLRDYLDLQSPWLERLIRWQPAVAVWPAASAMQLVSGGEGFFLRERVAVPGSELLRMLGELAPRNEVLPAFHVIVLVVVVTDLTVLISLVLRAERRDRWVMLGIAVTCVSIAYEVTSMRLGWRNAVPVLYAANLIEVLRITYVSTLEAGREVTLLEGEVRRQEEMIDNQIQELAAGADLRALGQRTFELGHEMRNPVASATLFIRAARRAVERGEDVRALLEKVELAMGQLGTLLTGISPHHREPRAPITMRVVHAVERAVALCAARIEEAGAAVEIEVAPDVWVRGRPASLAQVFVNLLTNACDAVRPLEDRRVEIRGGVRGETVEIRVRDPGPRPDGRHIFDPQFSNKGGGSGLGLSISRSVLEQLGGSIELDRDSPVTCFVVRLPSVSAAPDLRDESGTGGSAHAAQ